MSDNIISKKYTCYKCKTGFGRKEHIDNHFKRKKSCVEGDDSIPTCITTLFTACQFCSEQVKTETTTNYMEKHLKICTFKKTILSDKIETLFEYIKEVSNNLEKEENAKDDNILITKIEENKKEEKLKKKTKKVKKEEYKEIVSGVYIGYVEENILKVGLASNGSRRLIEHKKHLGNNFKFDYFFKTEDYKKLEKEILNHPEIEKRRIRKRYGPKNRLYTELIRLNDNFTITSFLNIVYDIKNDTESVVYYRNMALNLLEENKKLKE